jgi:hypothetical protein
MNKSELLNWLQEHVQQWEAYLDQIGPARMDQPGVNGDWSMKDIVTHLTSWNRWLVVVLHLRARRTFHPGQRLLAEDDISWIYESNRGRSVREVLDESHQTLQQLLATIESLPDDIRIKRVEPAFYLVWLGDERFPAGEFFDHFRDDHEPDVRAWLARVQKQ